MEKRITMLGYQIVGSDDSVWSGQVIYTTMDDARIINLCGMKFNELKRRGILPIGLAYEEDLWPCKDAKGNSSVSFSVTNKIKFEKYFAERIDEEDFVNYLKSYCLYKFDSFEQDGVQEKIRSLKEDCERSNYFTQIIYFSGGKGAQRRDTLIEFLRSLPLDFEEYIDDIKKQSIIGSRPAKKAQTLADAVTYYILDEEINEFWNGKVRTKERLFYYPFILYWKLTTLLALRCTEFCLTDYDCVYLDSRTGHYRIRYYVSTLKGASEYKMVTHSMADYELKDARITKELYDEFINYRRLIKKYDTKGKLFSTEIYKDTCPAKVNKVTEKFNYDHLSRIKNYFYEKILVDRKGYEIFEKEIDDSLPARSFINEMGRSITLIQNRDTRHIASINTLNNGSSLRALMVLTNHASAEMALHYATNSETFQRGRVYAFYRQHVLDRDTVIKEMSTSTNPMAEEEALVNQMKGSRTKVDMGNCYCNSAYVNTDRRDCIKRVFKGNKDICNGCPHMEPKEQTRKDYERFIRKTFDDRRKRMQELLPLTDGDSFRSIEKELEETRRVAADYTELVKGELTWQERTDTVMQK